jgi:hypothetical protein
MSSAVAATAAAVSASGSAPARTRVPSERLAVSLAAVSSTVIVVVVLSGGGVVVVVVSETAAVGSVAVVVGLTSALLGSATSHLTRRTPSTAATADLAPATVPSAMRTTQ